MQMLTEYTHFQITKTETELRARKNEAHSRNGIASRSFLSLSQKIFHRCFLYLCSDTERNRIILLW